MASKWEVRETKQIGNKTFWECYKVSRDGEIVTRGGHWDTKSDAELLAKILNDEIKNY